MAYDFIVQQPVREKFLPALENLLRDDFASLLRSNSRDVVQFHRKRLHDLSDYMRELKTHKSCLCCLLRAPEKVFTCGHALCDTCIRSFGHATLEEKNTFLFDSCIIYSRVNEKPSFSLMPPTAGVRLLSLDGGGVRGIVSLVILHELQSRLLELHMCL